MIIRINHRNRKQVIAFFEQHWGSTKMVVSTGTYDCAHLDGWVYVDNQQIVGLITYTVKGSTLEIVSLDSVREGAGIGSALVAHVETFAKQQQLQTIQLVTTNDNLQALKFYQKRGYRVTAVIVDAVNEARNIKLAIPLKGYDDIPLHDEFMLEKTLLKTNTNRTMM